MHVQPNHPFTPWPQTHPGPKHRLFIPNSTMESLAGLKATYVLPVFGVEDLVVSFPDLPESGKQTGMEVYTAESSVASRAFC